MTVNDPRRRENIDEDVGSATHINEVVVNFDPDDEVILRDDDRLIIVRSIFFSLEILESDSGVTLDEMRQLHSSTQEYYIVSPSNKRTRIPSGSGRSDGRGSD